MKSWADKFFENSWLRIMRHNSTTGAVEVNGAAVTGIPSYTLATIPAAASTALGAWINIPKSEFTNPTGMAGDGIYLRNDGVYWRPAFKQNICFEASLDSSYVATIAAGPVVITAFTLPNGEPALPWELQYPGLIVGVEFFMKRGGANATMNCSAHFGPSSTGTKTNNGVLASVLSLTAVDLGVAWGRKEAIIINSTKYVTNIQTGGAGSSTAIASSIKEKTIDLNTPYDSVLTLSATPAHASDSCSLMMYKMWIE